MRSYPAEFSQSDYKKLSNSCTMSFSYMNSPCRIRMKQTHPIAFLAERANPTNHQLAPSPMALAPGLLHSTASTFHGQLAPHSVRLPSTRCGGFSVKAMSPVVLVEKTESGKVERLKSAYLERIISLLKEEFNYANIHQVPKIKKIVVNCGIGDAAQNSKGLEER